MRDPYSDDEKRQSSLVTFTLFIIALGVSLFLIRLVLDYKSAEIKAVTQTTQSN